MTHLKKLILVFTIGLIGLTTTAQSEKDKSIIKTQQQQKKHLLKRILI